MQEPEPVTEVDKPKRVRKKKGEGVSGGALLSLKDLGAMHGQPADSIRAKRAPTAKPDTAKAMSGAGVDRMVGDGKRGKRSDIVKEVMKKHGLTLPAASKYVKEHKLY